MLLDGGDASDPRGGIERVFELLPLGFRDNEPKPVLLECFPQSSLSQVGSAHDQISQPPRARFCREGESELPLCSSLEGSGTH